MNYQAFLYVVMPSENGAQKNSAQMKWKMGTLTMKENGAHKNEGRNEKENVYPVTVKEKTEHTIPQQQ